MSQLDKILDYIYDTYGDEGAERLVNVKFIGVMCQQPQLPHDWKPVIDKVAAFNNIHKAQS